MRFLSMIAMGLAAAISAQGAAMHEVAVKAERPAGAPDYADVCFRYGWVRTGEFPTVEDAKKAMHAFHATRVDWFYPGSHTAEAEATYVTKTAREFIDWCHARGMKIGGAINSNTTNPDWGVRRTHHGRFIGHPSKSEFVAAAVAWGKAQIDAGVDTIVCDDFFGYRSRDEMQLFNDNVIKAIKAHKPGFTIAGNNGGFIGARYVKPYAFDFHYSDNSIVPDPGDWWAAAKAHRNEKSALVTHPNRPRTKEVHRGLIALGYASGAHVITPWDEYIHGGKRLFADPADFADLYGFAGALGQKGYLNGYEDAAVGGYDLEETRYGATPPITVTGGSGKLSVFGRAKPGNSGSAAVLHLVESGKPQDAKVHLRVSALWGTPAVDCTFLQAPTYAKDAHAAAAASGNYEHLSDVLTLTLTTDGDMLVIDVPPVKPWGVLVVQRSE